MKPTTGSALHLQTILATFGGTRLHGALSDEACRLAASLGVLQLFASAFSGLGACAFIVGLQWRAGPPPWSWLLCMACIVFFVVFDTALNQVLNVVPGLGHWAIKAARVGLTIFLSLTASKMLTLVIYAPSLDEPARNIAKARFDAALQGPSADLANAQVALRAAQDALAANANKAPAAPEIPPGCERSGFVLPQDDVLGRSLQARAQRQCAAVISQAAAAATAQQTAFSLGLEALRQGVEDARGRVMAAKAVLDEAQIARGETVSAQANTAALREAAYAQLREQDAGLNQTYYWLAGLGLLIEFMAILCKTAAARYDEGALWDQVNLTDRLVDLHGQSEANLLLMHFGQHAASSQGAKRSARALRENMMHEHLAEKATRPVSAKIFDFRGH